MQANIIATDLEETVYLDREESVGKHEPLVHRVQKPDNTGHNARRRVITHLCDLKILIDNLKDKYTEIVDELTLEVKLYNDFEGTVGPLEEKIYSARMSLEKAEDELSSLLDN